MVKGIDTYLLNGLLYKLRKGNGKNHGKKRTISPGNDTKNYCVFNDKGTEVEVMLERLKSAEASGKGRVHQVIKKLQNDELITSESVREAAERLLERGF